MAINGYSEESRKSVIHKYFRSNIELAKKLKEKIRAETKNNLRTLATSPWNALMLCVVFEDNEGDLSTTGTALHKTIVDGI